MDFNLIKKYVRLVETSGITELVVEEENQKIKISKRNDNIPVISQGNLPVSVSPLTQASVKTSSEEIKQAVKEKSLKLHEIKSPIVGTFYRAPAPDADPYIKIGDMISVGTVLCIVEAMKLMNEIESDVAGKVVKILAENGKPVEYGQSLFLIETS